MLIVAGSFWRWFYCNWYLLLIGDCDYGGESELLGLSLFLRFDDYCDYVRLLAFWCWLFVWLMDWLFVFVWITCGCVFSVWLFKFLFGFCCFAFACDGLLECWFFDFWSRIEISDFGFCWFGLFSVFDCVCYLVISSRVACVCCDFELGCGFLVIVGGNLSGLLVFYNFFGLEVSFRFWCTLGFWFVLYLCGFWFCVSVLNVLVFGVFAVVCCFLVICEFDVV